MRVNFGEPAPGSSNPMPAEVVRAYEQRIENSVEAQGKREERLMNTVVEGYCPMGCGRTLFLGDGGHVVCSWHKCPNPTAVHDLLADDLISEHVVRFGEDGFDVIHPLAERGSDLVACELHQHIRSLSGPPAQPGRYIARKQNGRWTWMLL